jgi:hypothetical protein
MYYDFPVENIQIKSKIVDDKKESFEILQGLNGETGELTLTGRGNNSISSRLSGSATFLLNATRLKMDIDDLNLLKLLSSCENQLNPKIMFMFEVKVSSQSLIFFKLAPAESGFLQGPCPLNFNYFDNILTK